MKKGVLFGLAALAVGVVVYTLGGKKEKPSNATSRPIYKWDLNPILSFLL